MISKKQWYLDLVLIFILCFHKFRGYMFFFFWKLSIQIFYPFSTELLGVLFVRLSLKIFFQFNSFSLCLFFYMEKFKLFYIVILLFPPLIASAFLVIVKKMFFQTQVMKEFTYAFFTVFYCFSFYNQIPSSYGIYPGMQCEDRIRFYLFLCGYPAVSTQLIKMFFASTDLKYYLCCISNFHMHLDLFLDFHQFVHQYYTVVIIEALKYV